jgi:hypothetical protein
MTFISLLGHGEFYLVVGVLIMWFYDYRKGWLFSNFAAMTTLTTEALKVLIAMERPIGFVKPLYDFGMPSAHSSTAVVFFMMIYDLFKRKTLLVIGVSMIVLIGLSRIFLNAHYPSQVLVGMLLGCLIYIAYRSKSNIKKIIYLVVCLLTLITVAHYMVNSNGLKNMKHIMQVLGLIIGINSGAYLYQKQSLNIIIKGKVAKVIGIIGILSLYMGTKIIVDNVFVDNLLIPYLILHSILAFALSFLGPYIIERVSK